MDNYADETSMPWYAYQLQIKNIVISDGITSVGDYAFSGAKNLISVDIPESVKSVGKCSFSSCSSLTELELGGNVTSIGDTSFAFDGVDKKSDFSLVTTAGTYALNFAKNNDIPFTCSPVTCGTYDVKITVANMKAYYPYVAKVDGTFKFYSTGNHDTQGWLYGSDFSLISSDSYSGTGANFSITAKLTKGETYYIATKILNSRILDSYQLVIEPVEYSVNVSVSAMLNPSGQASDIALANATIDGEPVGDSTTISVNGWKSATIACDGVERTYTFSPDDGEDVNIPLMMCDFNNDGWVNAKDYALMLKADSIYMPLYENFINYHLTNSENN
jgi:hypothetical protein